MPVAFMSLATIKQEYHSNGVNVMIELDARTLVYTVGSLAILSTLILLMMSRFFPEKIQGLNHWSLGTLSLIIASALIRRRGEIPDWLSIVLANSLVILGLLLFISALLRFYQRRGLTWRQYLMVTLPVTLTIVCFTYGVESFQARLLVMAAAQAVLFGILCVIPLRLGKFRSGEWVFSGGVGFSAVVSAVRFVSSLSEASAPQHLLDGGSLQAIYLASFSVTLLVGTIGFILLANEKLREQLEYLATYDSLSQVLNRRAFFERAQNMLAQGQRDGEPVAVLLFDIDDFKRINDQLGHHVGDKVITSLCQIAKGQLTEKDLLGRYGGEEFALMLKVSHQAHALEIAQRIRRAIESGASGIPEMSETDLPHCTASMGLALARPADTVNSLLVRADQALYRAKHAGKNRVETAPG